MALPTYPTEMSPRPQSQTAPDLPVPTPDEVEELRALYRSKFGVELNPETALELLTSLVGFFYLTHYPAPNDPIRPLREKEPGR